MGKKYFLSSNIVLSPDRLPFPNIKNGQPNRKKCTEQTQISL